MTKPASPQSPAGTGGPAPGSIVIKRPIDRADHPIVNGNYRIGTPAIEAFYALILACLNYRITGALIFGPSRIGKTRAIEYLRLLMAEKNPKVTTYHVQAEHKPKHAEGPFFTSLLEAVGCPDPDRGTNSTKRLKLINRVKDACTRNGSGAVVMFFDEAQRYGENEYEWLRDVHDHLDRINIRLFAFLIGQQGLRAVKTAFQQENKTQIVARLMVEELRFQGLRDAADTATCLQSYDTTRFPRGSNWSFTRFFAPLAVTAGYKLADDAQVLWNAFEELHNKSNLPGELEIPMESFARAVEITLKNCWDRDPLSMRPDQALWQSAVQACGYVQARLAIRKELMPMTAATAAAA